MIGFANSGFKTVSAAKYYERKAICEACEHWQGEAMFGYGKCGKCGCASVKLAIASESCVMNPPKWPKEI
jgi:hypothetical protein